MSCVQKLVLSLYICTLHPVLGLRCSDPPPRVLLLILATAADADVLASSSFMSKGAQMWHPRRFPPDRDLPGNAQARQEDPFLLQQLWCQTSYLESLPSCPPSEKGYSQIVFLVRRDLTEGLALLDRVVPKEKLQQLTDSSISTPPTAEVNSSSFPAAVRKGDGH